MPVVDVITETTIARSPGMVAAFAADLDSARESYANIKSWNGRRRAR